MGAPSEDTRIERRLRGQSRTRGAGEKQCSEVIGLSRSLAVPGQADDDCRTTITSLKPSYLSDTFVCNLEPGISPWINVWAICLICATFASERKIRYGRRVVTLDQRSAFNCRTLRFKSSLRFPVAKRQVCETVLHIGSGIFTAASTSHIKPGSVRI